MSKGGNSSCNDMKLIIMRKNFVDIKFGGRQEKVQN